MIINLYAFVENLLKVNNILISTKSNKKKIIHDIACYIDTLVFNIVSIGSIIAHLNNSNKIKKENINIIKNYIQENCNFKYHSKGGGDYSLPSEFYGNNSDRYHENNKGQDVLIVDWNKGIARPEINLFSGGGTKKLNVIIEYIKKILIYYKITASKDILKELLNIFEHHLKCLLNNLKKCDKEITNKCVHQIVNNNNILKILK